MMKKSLNAEEVRDLLRKDAGRYGSQAALADEIGISRSQLNLVLKGKREPAGEVLTWLRVKREVRYVRDM